MIFVDEAKIIVEAGGGGKGCESFYSDKMTRYPRPDGGDGGDGGDIVAVVNKKIQTLLDFRFQQHYKAERGGHGSSKGKRGRNGGDCILKVPIGTVIRDFETGLQIKDLVVDGQTVVVAKGGQGGRGNNHNRKVIPAGKGEHRILHLELKLIADVGIIGFPNAGKSTFISSISRVKSKIANYPFTTKQPILGFIQGDDEDSDFIIADLPGLIEGAHEGRGLGDRFLRHAERTKILVHMLDMSGSEDRDPLEDYRIINHELEQYSSDLFFKKRIVVANKMDLPGSGKNLKRFKRKFKEDIISISALEKNNLEELVEKIKEILCHERLKEKSSVSL